MLREWVAVSDSWLLIFEGVVAAAAVGVVFFLLAVILGIARNRRLQHGLQMVLALEAISSEALQCAVVVVATAGNLAVAATAAATNPAILRFFAASCGGVLLSFHTDTLAVWVHGIWTCVLVPALRAWGMPLLEIGRIAFNTVVGANNAVRRAAKHALRAVVDTAFECMDLEELLRRATVGVQDLTLLLGDTVRIAGEALSGLANYADETPREHVDLAPLCARLRTTLVNAAPPLQCACPVAFTVVDIALTVATGDEACDLAAAAADVLLDAATTALRTLLLLRRPVVAPLRAATTRLVDASYAFACLATRSFVDTLLPEVPVVSAAATVAVVKEAFLAPVRTGALYAVAFAFWLADLAVHIDVVLDTRAEARMEAEAYLDPSDLVLRADELCGVPGRAAIAVMDAVYPARPEPLADCAAGASLLLGLPLLPPRLVVGAVSTAWTCAWEVVRAGSAGLRPAALEATVRTAMRAAVWDRLPAMGIAPLSLLQVVEEAMGVVRNRRDGVADLAIPWPPNARPGRTNWSPDSPVALAGAHAWMAFLHLAQYWTEAILHFVQVVASGFTNAPVHCMTLADDTALRTAALGSVESAAKAAIAAVVAYFPGDITVCATTFARALLPVVLAVADAVLPTVCPARGEVPFRMDGLTLSMVTTGARATVAAIACVATEMVAKSIAHNDDGYCYGGPLGTPRGYLANPPAELRPYNNLACYASTHKLRKVVVKDVLVVVGTSILVAPLEVLQELFPTSGGFAEAAGLKRAYERVVGAAASLLQGAARGAACAGSPSLSDGLCMGGALVAAAGLTVGDAVVEIGNTAAEAVLCVLAGDLPCAADEILILVQLVADLVFSIFNDMVMELLCTLLTAVFGEDLARFFMGIIELFVSGLCGVLSLLMTGVTAVVNGIVGVLNALCAGLNGVVGIFGARIECTVPSLQLSAITCPAPPGGSRTYCGGTPVSLEPIPATATVQVEKLNLDNLKSLATACNACRGADQPSCLYEVRVCAVAYASGNPSGAATCIDYGGCLARKTVTLLGVTSTGEGADTMVVIGANAWQAVLAKVSEGRGGRPPDEPWTWVDFDACRCVEQGQVDGIPDTSLAYYNTNCPVVLSILEAAPFYETFETILGPHGIEKPTNAQSACPATAGGGRRRLVSVRNLLQGSPAPSSETQGDVHIIPDPFKDLKDSLADATRFVHARLLHVQGSWAEAHAGALQRREERRGRVAYRSEGEASKDTTGHVVGWLMGSIHGALSGMRVPEGYAQEVAGGARSPAKARAPEQSLASQEGEEGRSRAARGLLGTLNNAVQEGAASLNLDVTCPLLARVATGVATSVDIAASYYGGRYQESLRDALPAFHAFSPMEATTCQPPTFPPERLGELVRSVPRTPASAAPWSRVPWPSVPSEGNTSLLSICLQGPAGAEEGGVANGTRPRRSGRVETDPTVDFAGARLLARVWDWLEAILGACIMEGEAPSLAAVGDALVAWSKGLLGDVQGAAVDLLSCEDYDTVVACEHEHRLGGLRLLRSAASVAWPLALGALVTIAMGGSGVLSCMAFVAPVVAVLCAWAVLYDTYGWGPGCSSGLPVCLADDVVSTADSLLGMEVVWPAALRKGQVTGVSRGGGGCDACFDPPLFVNCAVDTGIADPLRATAYLVHRAWPTEVALVVAELRDALPFLARYVETLAGRAEVAPDTYMACAGVALVPSLPLLAFMVWPVTSALVAVVQMVVALAVRSFRLTFYCLVALYLGLAAVEDAAF